MPRTFVRADQLKSATIKTAHIAADAAIAMSQLATNPLARANHTGTQSADTIVDGSNNKALTNALYDKLDGIAAGATVNSPDATLLARANHTGEQAISTVTGLQTALDAKQASSAKGQANGYASLDGSGKVPSAQLPDIAVGALAYQSTWNASTNTPELTSATGTKGHYYKVATAGSTALDGVSEWAVGDWAVFNGTAWEKIDQSEAVASVHGRTGAVVAAASDYDADQVDFTPAGGIAATDVQAAIEELDSEKARLDSFVDAEDLTDDVDGTEDEFTLANTPVAGSEHVFLNGVRQRAGSGNDYTISGALITFTVAPAVDDNLVVGYRK